MAECNEFEPELKSAKNRFHLSAGLNLEKLNTIMDPTINDPRLNFKPRLKFFKFVLSLKYFLVEYLPFTLLIHKIEIYIEW